MPGWSSVHRDPLGVVLIMGAWNYPLHLTLLPLVGAIAAGNCAVIKPPSLAVHTSNAIAQLVPKYLDPQCFLVIEGGIPISTETLKQKFDLIFYTGSGAVARIIMTAAAKHLTPVVLELGGKSPCVITPDADLELAARRVSWGSFLNAGQTCVRPDYVLVHPAVAKRFVELLQARIRAMFGENSEKSGEYGRIINVSNTERLRACIEEARPNCTVHGGQTNVAERFVAPTILDFGSDDTKFIASKAMSGEIFGPILPVFAPADGGTFLDWCINFINSHDKPLAMHVFTTSSSVRTRFKEETSSGALLFNDCMMHVTNERLPFGGVGPSGLGAYHGHRSFEAFSHPKAVLRKTSFLDLSFRYPPYTKWGKTQATMLMKPRPHWQFTLAYLFGVLLLLVVIAIAVIGGNPTARSWWNGL